MYLKAKQHKWSKVSTVESSLRHALCVPGAEPVHVMHQFTAAVMSWLVRAAALQCAPNSASVGLNIYILFRRKGLGAAYNATMPSANVPIDSFQPLSSLLLCSYLWLITVKKLFRRGSQCCKYLLEQTRTILQSTINDSCNDFILRKITIENMSSQFIVTRFESKYIYISLTTIS